MGFEEKEVYKGYETVKESKKEKQQTLPTATLLQKHTQHTTNGAKHWPTSVISKVTISLSSIWPATYGELLINEASS